VLGPLVNVFRASVNEAFLPSMSRMQAAGDASGMAGLNSRANVTVGWLLYPAIAFAFFFAEDLVSFVYTDAYLPAAPVMRVYLFAYSVMVIEVGSMVLLLTEGRFALRLNLGMLAFSGAVSWSAATHFGLAGAAAGSAASLYLDRFFTLRRISKRTGIPVRRLQDWSGLACAVAYGAGAGLFAWGAAEAFAEGGRPFVRLVIGGTALLAAYGLLFLLKEGNLLKKKRGSLA
jgi:O-antigen/teichoic acid export membrane protein